MPAVRLTVDEYLAADLPEGFRYELVDGVVTMAPKPAGEHDDLVGWLADVVAEYSRLHRGTIAKISQNASVSIPGSGTVRHPDLAVYTEWEKGRRDSAVWREFTPALVVEVVSAGQERRDYVEKQREYWRAGIREYWIVDPGRGTVTLLSRSARAWTKRTIKGSRRVNSVCFPGLYAGVTDLFGWAG